ncbi:hypothetical protein [Nocardia salmonicida]|uniref:hypothetical protein n=1 Tax=Nocardia salmonicida TaxID=53431 RepID=UPI003645C134
MEHTTFVAVSKYGRVFTRSTKTMEYTHAVLATKTDSTEVAWSWHKTEAAARKAAGNVLYATQVVDLVALPYSSAEAKTHRAGSENK